MEVKGVALTSLPTFIQQRFSEAGFHQWLEALSEEQRKELAEPVLEQNWYPLREYFIEPTQVMCDLFITGICWERGRTDGSAQIMDYQRSSKYSSKLAHHRLY